MTQRQIRVAELVMRELSSLLHSRWRSETQNITLTEVSVSADLQKCRIYYSVIGGREEVAKAGKTLMKLRSQLRFLLGKNVTLKYTPELHFFYDPSVERGMRIIEMLDALEDEALAEADFSEDAALADALEENEDSDIPESNDDSSAKKPRTKKSKKTAPRFKPDWKHLSENGE